MGERMDLITMAQIKAIHALLNRLGLLDEKQQLVFAFSEGRCESTKELTRQEAKRVLAHLSGMVKPTEQELAKEKMKKKVLGIAHDLGWETTNGKIDMSRLNNWCVKSSYLHKILDKYTYEELPRLVTQIEKVYAWNAKNKL